MKLPPPDMFLEHRLKSKNYVKKVRKVIQQTEEVISNRADIHEIRYPKFLKKFFNWLEQKIQ